jgi:lysophospholipase L1-like esterase
LIAKIASNTGIPWENVIDSDKFIRKDSMMIDGIHPNEQGYGVLAPEIYMRLAFSS